MSIIKSFTYFLLTYFCMNPLFADELLVGIASVDLTPSKEEQIPLGGYGSMARRDWKLLFKLRPFGRHFKIAQGVEDEIRSKAMFVFNPVTDQKLLFISIDVVGVTKQMQEDLYYILADLGFKKEELIISGTHTHSGPGGLANNKLWSLMAMDKFRPKFYDKFLRKIKTSVLHAMKNQEPATLYQLNAETSNLIRNRRGSDRPVNNSAKLLIAQNQMGQWLGGIVNFAVHGTWFNANNLKFSSDVPGAIEQSLENWLTQINGVYTPTLIKPVFLFINGAQGDISPNMHYKQLAQSLVDQIKPQWNEMRRVYSKWKVRSQQINLGRPKINMKKCIDKRLVPRRLNLPLRRWISSETILTQVEFDDFIFLTWPGEPTTQLGYMLQDLTQNERGKKSWVLGLTNDHLAYFLTPDEFDTGGYEACTNFFGRNGGIKIIEEHKKILKE